jgi:very-short-patch-repair endonuclease
MKSTTDQFIEKSKKIHGDKYNYSLVNYINSYTKVKIKCGNNHIFEQRPCNHLDGQGCVVCSPSYKKNTELFIKKANEIHDGLYDYSLVDYKTNSTKVKIICKKHGVFETRAVNHLTLKRGCPHCKISKNEILISKILLENNIKFEQQKKFEKCRYKSKLMFDFYLPNFNICIEYDGKQHYEDIYNSEIEFKNVQLRDEIKNKFCKENKINLLRIKYNENVNDKLKLLIESCLI